MSTQFDLIDGVLLATTTSLTTDMREACENSLLLSWLAAIKANEKETISTVMGKLGWAMTNASSSQKDVDLGKAGSEIITLLTGKASDTSLFAPILSATNGEAYELAAAWWQKATLGHALAFAQGKHLTLLIAEIIQPDPWRISFDPRATTKLSISNMQMELNDAVWDQIKGDVATKVAPYRKDIKTYPPTKKG